MSLHLGSALRLLPPLSGLLASTSSTALFHAATVPGLPPSESSPRRNREPLSRPHAPSWSSTDARRRAARALSPPVSPTPTLARGSLDSLTTMGSLSSRRSTDPGHPGHRATGSSHPASFTHLEALILPRVRSRATRVAPDRTADPLLDFFPSEVFSVYAWDPRTRPGLATRTAPTPEGPGDRRRGPLDPPSRWARRNARVQGDEPLGSIPTPFGAGPDRLSAALLLP